MRGEHAITNLGDLASGGLVAVFVCVWAWMARARIAAAIMGAGFAFAVVLTAVLKTFAVQYAQPPWLSDLFAFSTGAPSGHSVVAVSVYGGAALLFWFLTEGVGRFLGPLYCLAVIVGVGVTRVTLQTHTIADVLGGFALAACVLSALFYVLTRLERQEVGNAGALLAGMVVIALTVHFLGLSITSNQFI
jgi:membrane-associated phospholipid phosphatase